MRCNCPAKTGSYFMHGPKARQVCCPWIPQRYACHRRSIGKVHGSPKIEQLRQQSFLMILLCFLEFDLDVPCFLKIGHKCPGFLARPGANLTNPSL